MAALVQAPMGWFNEMVDGARKAFGLAGIKRRPRPARPVKAKKRAAATRSKLDYRARASLTRRLADEGFDLPQIARRTGLSQDTVSLLLKMAPESPEETAGNGKIFRIFPRPKRG